MRLPRIHAARSLRLTALLVAVLALPAGTLVWLGVKLARQDRELLAQQHDTQRKGMLRNVTQSLALSLARAEQNAAEGVGTGDVVQFTVVGDGLRASPAASVLWVPRAPELPAIEGRILDDTERLEYGDDPSAALERYASLTTSTSPAIRAGALLGLARMQRRARAWDAALATYATLRETPGIAVAGAPADLQARRARCAVLADAGRLDALRREATSLESDWLAGVWLLDRPTWELVASDLRQWTGHDMPPGALRAAFSAAAERFWAAQNGHANDEAIPLDTPGQTVVFWPRSGPTPGALAATPERLQAWIDDAATAAGLPASAVSLRLSSATLPGETSDTATDLVASPADTGLPWFTAVTVPPVDPAAWTRGQLLLLAFLATLIVFVASGGYAIARLIRREFAVARLQAEFVAAVSHEFRTPLASIRHFTDLLDESDDLPADKRRGFYRAVGRNAERLQRLVESLLDFSRMESGAAAYVLAPVDVSRLVTSIVSDFRGELLARGGTATIAVDAADPIVVEADSSSLSLALWNLLDNAVKYSPGDADIRVSARAHAGVAVIAVGDRGYGIPKAEQGMVFGQFARGEVSRRHGIKGTGIGLAIVAHVAQGHGGEVRVESVEGEGSEFQLVLPVTRASQASTLPLAPDVR